MIILFAIGTAILIVTTTILSYLIPKLTTEIELCDLVIRETEKTIFDRQSKYQEFLLLDTERSLAGQYYLDSMEPGNLDLHKQPAFLAKTKALNVRVMTDLLESAGEEAIAPELIEKWNDAAVFPSQEERAKYVDKYKKELERLASEQKNAECKKRVKSKTLSNVTLWTALFQVLALFLVGCSEVLSKIKSK